MQRVQGRLYVGITICNDSFCVSMVVMCVVCYVMIRDLQCTFPKETRRRKLEEEAMRRVSCVQMSASRVCGRLGRLGELRA